MDALPLVCVLLAVGEARAVEADLARFPCRQVALEAWQFSAAHRSWVDAQTRTCPPGELSEWLCWLDDAHRCYWPWHHLDDAHRFSTTAARRESLERLRWHLGEDDWHAGRMPPPVPWWRFTRR